MGKLREKLECEVKAQRGLPDCPRHLRGRARAAWNFWRAELEAMDIDRRPDAHMLEGACVNYGRAVEADLMIAREGLTVEESIIDDETKEKIVLKVRNHPAVAISNAAWRLVRAFCSEFGFSPVSRARLPAKPAEEKNEDLMELLSKPRRAQPSATIQ